MRSTLPRGLLEYAYRKAELDYLRSLPLEHFMESTSQSNQRKITLASLALVQARRPDFQLFNELLVQYPLPKSTKFGQVVPDNMVVKPDKQQTLKLLVCVRNWRSARMENELGLRRN